MVQRKPLNKPLFKASPSLEEKFVKKPLIGSMKPSIKSLDSGKAKGADLAKKMKKSGSIKRSPELENLKKSSLRRNQVSSDDQPAKSSSSPSPNYMKSTSSSEARKEQKQTPTKSVIESSTSKRLFSSPPPKSVSRSSSLSKVRTLTKAPSFKPSRSVKSVKKCDVKRNTCSSTIKDSKFPNYLDLSPGGTESQGTSIMKVCPYNYCSLNGHLHKAAPPLKSFLSTRRRMMKAQRSMKPVVTSPCKIRPCLDDDQGKQEVAVADKPAPILFQEEKADYFIEIYAEGESEVGSKNFLDQEKEEELKDGDSGKKGDCDEDVVLDEYVFDVVSFDWESSRSIVLDELFNESSDMDWEEEEFKDEGDVTSTIGNEGVCYLDGGFKEDYVNMDFLKEFLAEEFSQDVIIDCHEQLSDSDLEKELDQFSQGNCDDMLVPSAAANEEKTEELPQNFPLVEDQGNENTPLNKEITNDAEEVEEESTKSIPEQNQPMSDNKPSGEFNRSNLKKESTDASSIISITKGKRNRSEEPEELKCFNPREPNYLEVEPDPESERVDLRHQEMDERRNSEEWMLDFALRKAVDQLAPARKRKVAMLVAAFETVSEPPVRPISSHFARLQACN